MFDFGVTTTPRQNGYILYKMFREVDGKLYPYQPDEQMGIDCSKPMIMCEELDFKNYATDITTGRKGFHPGEIFSLQSVQFYKPGFHAYEGLGLLHRHLYDGKTIIKDERLDGIEAYEVELTKIQSSGFMDVKYVNTTKLNSCITMGYCGENMKILRKIGNPLFETVKCLIDPKKWLITE